MLLSTQAWAVDKRAVVLETKKSGFKDLSRGLRVTLKQNHNYASIKDSDLLGAAKRQGLGTGAKPAQLAAVAKGIGADIVVFAYAEAVKGEGWQISVKVESTDGRGNVLNKTFRSQKNKLDRTLATEIARAIRTADATGVASTDSAGEGGLDFSLDASAETPAATSGGDGMNFDMGGGGGETATDTGLAIKAAPKQLQAGDNASEEDEESAAAELENDDEFYEPSDSDSEIEEPRYVPPDGRTGLVATAGLSMLLRNTATSAANGTPPSYTGVLSPGVALGLSIFPRRFKDGGGIARDFGIFARAHITFMPSELVTGGVAQNYTDGMFGVQAGAAFRHVFGNQEKSIAFGAQLGVAYDQVNLDRTVPFPTTAYISPFVAAELEAPLYRKLAVLVVRAGVLPVSSLSRTAIEAFGARSFAFGVTGALGVHSTLWNDALYLDVSGHVTNYWQEFSAAGTSRYTDVTMRDLVGGFTIAAGLAY